MMELKKKQLKNVVNFYCHIYISKSLEEFLFRFEGHFLREIKNQSFTIVKIPSITDSDKKIRKELANKILNSYTKPLLDALQHYAKDYDYKTGTSQWDGGEIARCAIHDYEKQL